MSKLLNKGNVFVVTREDMNYGQLRNVAVIGVFSELDEADDYLGMCKQQWKEKVGEIGKECDPVFDIQLTTYYGK